jgi:hypothetical protein
MNIRLQSVTTYGLHYVGNVDGVTTAAVCQEIEEGNNGVEQSVGKKRT